jgi:hypothetical protein
MADQGLLDQDTPSALTAHDLSIKAPDNIDKFERSRVDTPRSVEAA